MVNFVLCELYLNLKIAEKMEKFEKMAIVNVKFSYLVR